MLTTTTIKRETETETIEIEVDFEYMPGTRDYFCRSFGNWLPGDPSEFYVLEARRTDTLEEVELTDAEIAAIEAEAPAIYEAELAEAVISAYEDRMSGDGWCPDV